MAKNSGSRKSESANGADKKPLEHLRHIEPYLSLCGVNLQVLISMCAAIATYFGVIFGGIGPMSAVAILWLALVVIVVAAGPRADSGVRHRFPSWVRGSLFVIGFGLVAYVVTWILRDTILDRPRATVAELRGRDISNRTVYLGDIPLSGQGDSMVIDKRFTKCTFKGPGVIALSGDRANSIDGMVFGAPLGNPGAIFYELTPGRTMYAGVIGFDGVELVDCRSEGVGWLLSKEEISRVMQKTEYFPNRIPGK